MKRNMGNVDRVIRVLIALLILGAWISGFISGTLSLVLLIIAGVFVVTSIFATCPMYRVLGISTCSTPRNHETLK